MVIKIHKSDISLIITALVIVSFMVAIFRNQEKEQKQEVQGGVIRLGISSSGPSKIQNASMGIQDMKVSGSGFQGNNSSLQRPSYNAFNNSERLNIR